METEPGPKIENREKDKISRINFLIHPGYDSQLRQLFDIYIEKAKSLRNDELMILLPWVKRKNMKWDLAMDKPYAQTIKTIREILGRRLIVLGDKGDILWEQGAKKSWNRIKKIIEARGYYFDEDVESEAYGEYCDACVSVGAAFLNIAGGLKRKTIIKPEFTDLKYASRDGEMEEFKRAGPSLAEDLKKRVDVE